jgi:hypothetical protein
MSDRPTGHPGPRIVFFGWALNCSTASNNGGPARARHAGSGHFGRYRALEAADCLPTVEGPPARASDSWLVILGDDMHAGMAESARSARPLSRLTGSAAGIAESNAHSLHRVSPRPWNKGKPLSGLPASNGLAQLTEWSP